MATQCVCCTIQNEQCRNDSSRIWHKLPPRLQRKVCAVLENQRVMKRCSSDWRCSVCSTHLKVALRLLLRTPASMVLTSLVEMALCKTVGWTSGECEEMFSSLDGDRWIAPTR